MRLPKSVAPRAPSASRRCFRGIGLRGTEPFCVPGASPNEKWSRRLDWSCACNLLKFIDKTWCPGAELNHRHRDFQSRALPTELPGRRARGCEATARARGVIEARPGAVQNARSTERSGHWTLGARCCGFTRYPGGWHRRLPALMPAREPANEPQAPRRLPRHRVRFTPPRPAAGFRRLRPRPRSPAPHRCQITSGADRHRHSAGNRTGGSARSAACRRSRKVSFGRGNS